MSYTGCTSDPSDSHQAFIRLLNECTAKKRYETQKTYTRVNMYITRYRNDDMSSSELGSMINKEYSENEIRCSAIEVEYERRFRASRSGASSIGGGGYSTYVASGNETSRATPTPSTVQPSGNWPPGFSESGNVSAWTGERDDEPTAVSGTNFLTAVSGAPDPNGAGSSSIGNPPPDSTVIPSGISAESSSNYKNAGTQTGWDDNESTGCPKGILKKGSSRFTSKHPSGGASGVSFAPGTIKPDPDGYAEIYSGIAKRGNMTWGIFAKQSETAVGSEQGETNRKSGSASTLVDVGESTVRGSKTSAGTSDVNAHFPLNFDEEAFKANPSAFGRRTCHGGTSHAGKTMHPTDSSTLRPGSQNGSHAHRYQSERSSGDTSVTSRNISDSRGRNGHSKGQNHGNHAEVPVHLAGTKMGSFWPISLLSFKSAFDLSMPASNELRYKSDATLTFGRA